MSKNRTLICLIRHGETTWNRAGRWQGHADPELTGEGLAAADSLAEALAVEQRERPWTRLISSDLARARITAARVGERLGLPLALDPRLRELDIGRWAGLTRQEIAERDAELLLAFERGEPGIRPGGGETRIEIRERSHACFRELVERMAGERILVVTHLGVIRALVPGARPENLARCEVVGEEIVARPIDRTQRPEEGPL